ncbi:hypothetical protein DFQ26_001738 [Actinomortierella ambigua]|nr:hypothetical protein DFQ26_001738 [Actinomortierella ambigua]
MEVPEIRLYVGNLLASKDLRACALVCRAWHREYQPLVWRNFTVHLSDASSQVQSVRNNVRWIRNLDLGEWSPTLSTTSLLYDILATECRSLVSLDVKLNRPIQWDQCQVLLHHNKDTLRCITITEGEWTGPNDQQLVDTMDDLKSLEVLAFIRFSPSISALLCLVASMPLLRTVYCGVYKEKSGTYGKALGPNLIHPWLSPTLPTMEGPFASLKKFNFRGPCRDPMLVTLFRRCPLLVRLQLSEVTDEICEGLCELLRDGHFPHLRSVQLQDQFHSPFHTRSILSSFPSHQLTTVKLYHPSMMTVQVLVEHHHQTLQDVDIEVPHYHEGSIIELLSRCPQLLYLRFFVKGVGVDVRHAIARPWVCTRLKELKVGFSLDEDCQDEELLDMASEEKEAVSGPDREEHDEALTVFMMRLGQLTQLREVDFYPVGYVGPLYASEILPLSMANGFAHLDQWTRLERLSFGPIHVLPLGIPELQFMRQHWTSLKILSSACILS